MKTRRNSLMVQGIAAFSSLLVCLALLSGCAVNPVTGQSQLMLVSEEQEIEMGRQLYPNALWGAEGGGGEYRDEALKSYLKGVVLNIHRISHRPNLPVDFAVQNSSVPNAWAIPGHVVMTRGLLAGLENEAEFAFVMGHEMGHVAARHSAAQMSKGMLTQAVLAGAGIAVGGSPYSDMAMTLGALGGNLLLLQYSRSDELEADRLGIVYMSRLGYDPRNAVSAHRNLEKISNDYMRSLGQNTQERSFFGDLLSSHPRTAVRIDEIERIIGATPRSAPRGDGADRARFQTMTARVRKTNVIYRDQYDRALRAAKGGNLTEASNLISRAITLDGSQAPFHGLQGLIYLERKNYDGAEKSFQAALRLDPNYQPAHRGLGMVDYTSGRYQEGIAHLQRSVALFPEDVPSRYFLGVSQYRTKGYRAAIPNLKFVAEAQPKHPRVHGILGMCYEQVNDLSSAYTAYAMQLRVDPNNEVGKEAATRARVIGPRLGR